MELAPALAALAMALQGGSAVEKKKTPSFEEMIRMRVVLSVPGMDAVITRRNLVYKTADGQPLQMDVYSPPAPPRPRPAVILVHGGPIPMLGAKNMGVFASWGELLAASGFVAVAFDHRFLAPARLPDAAADVADLVAHLRTNAASLGVDPDRLAVWAFSGGGRSSLLHSGSVPRGFGPPWPTTRYSICRSRRRAPTAASAPTCASPSRRSVA